jgi:orotate phosphoribosyltransferase
MAIQIVGKTAGPVAAQLLEIGAIRLYRDKPFTWSSGWKSPIYCDNRFSLSFPELRTYIKNSLAEVIRTQFPTAEVIAGVATAGIPQGALVADELGLPFAYVRPKPKDHGMENLIEGRIQSGQSVVLVEDLISTGGSSLKAAAALRDAGARVAGMVAIFTYGFDTAAANFEKDKTELVCLSDFNHLLPEAVRKNLISSDQLEHIKAWRSDPANWK